jgi:hypothetical protein
MKNRRDMKCCPWTLRPWLILLVGLLASPHVLRADDKAPAPSRWEEAIRQFEQQDAESPPESGGVLFIGSSSIRLWDLKESFPNLKAINRGFGGSQLADVVHFADRIILPYRPRLVIVYAGDNDLAAGKTPEQVIDDYRRLVEAVHTRLPETKIAYIAVKPSLARWKIVDQGRQVNRTIADLA